MHGVLKLALQHVIQACREHWLPGGCRAALSITSARAPSASAWAQGGSAQGPARTEVVPRGPALLPVLLPGHGLLWLWAEEAGWACECWPSFRTAQVLGFRACGGLPWLLGAAARVLVLGWAPRFQPGRRAGS